MPPRPSIEEQWRLFLTGQDPNARHNRHVFGLLPAEPRCVLCHAPFSGIGSIFMKTLFKKRPSKLNPKYCSTCDDFVSNALGGTELEISMLFVDVRGGLPESQKRSHHPSSRNS